MSGSPELDRRLFPCRTSATQAKLVRLPEPRLAWAAAGPALENARSLHRSACLLSERDLFGQATSMSVLALEEAAKSAVFAVQGLDQIPTLQEAYDETRRRVPWLRLEEIDLASDLSETQRDHKTKHAVAGWLLAFFIIARTGIGSSLDRGPVGQLRVLMYQLLNPKSQMWRLLRLLGWLRRAEDLKKLGLYVDVKVGLVRGPRNVERSDFRLGSDAASFLIEVLSKAQESTSQAREDLLDELTRHRRGVVSAIAEFAELLDEKELATIVDDDELASGFEAIKASEDIDGSEHA